MDRYAVVIAGPSGAGKTTIADSLIETLGNLEMSRSATTRAKRGDGRDDEYVYISCDEFERAIKDEDVVEYTIYSGNYYGTRKCELDRIFLENKHPILVLDYNGVRSLKEKLDYPVFAIYVYTTLDEAERRLLAEEFSKSDSEADAKAIADLRARIQELTSEISINPVYITFANAQQAMNKLMNDVNAEIKFCITGERDNCTHDCSTCSGCH